MDFDVIFLWRRVSDPTAITSVAGGIGLNLMAANHMFMVDVH